MRYSLQNPHAYVDSNLVGFVNVLEGCRHNTVQHLVYASSSSVYGGNTKMPFSEGDPVDHPVSLYAATKKANELMAHSYSHLYRLPTTGLRYFTVYGPWGRPDMSPWLFTSAILEGRTIDVFNHGKMQRDFTYIDDIADGMGFKKLFWVRFTTVSLPGLASIPLALNGMGYWALVAGTLVGQLVQVMMLWRTSHWRPAFNFDIQIAKEMGRFGAWVGTSGLLAWFYVWADSLIVGMYLGTAARRRGNRAQQCGPRRRNERLRRRTGCPYP